MTDSQWTQARVDEARDLARELPACGCGSGTFWDIVLLMLERRARLRDEDPIPEKDERLSYYDPAPDASARWVEFAAHVLSDGKRSLLEHGSSVGWSWLTAYGEDLLAFLRAFGTDDDDWPCHSDDHEWAEGVVFEADAWVKVCARCHATKNVKTGATVFELMPEEKTS